MTATSSTAAASTAGATWRVRLIAVAPVPLLLAVQPLLLGLGAIAASPVDQDVPATALMAMAIDARLLPLVALLLAGASALLAALEAREGAARGAAVVVPWVLGLVPLVFLSTRAIALHHRQQRGTGPLVLSIGLLAGGTACVAAELVVILVIALQHSAPLT